MTSIAPNPARTQAPPGAAVLAGADTGGATAWQAVKPARSRVRERRWQRFLWSLVYPYRGNRLLLTLPGALVLCVVMGLGAAAYNTSNNILFISLSLMLACLIVSGLLSWLNLRNLSWRLRVQPPLRVGREHPVHVELNNAKTVLPTYGVWFELSATGEKRTVRLPLRERLDPRSTAVIEWMFKPERRGAHTVEMLTAASLFPFGFLKKLIGSQLKREVLVWPAPVEYQKFPLATWHRAGHVERAPRAGQGGDLLALRAYAQGDSQRQVHWKASARLRKLMVKQDAAETQTGFALWVRTSADEWPRPEQFELMCSLAATLAEDLFRAGRLTAVSVNDEAPTPVRRAQDLDRFLDRLALVKPEPVVFSTPANAPSAHRANMMTFAPDGPRGVIAYVDGTKAATA